MDKMFYSAEEAAERLGKTLDGLKDLARSGKLREFRDAGKVNYKTEDVDALAGELAPASSSVGSSISSASATGEIVLEPVDEGDSEPVGLSSDILNLAETEPDAADTAAGSVAAKKKKEGTVVPSIGVNVFDDAELDEHVDPLAQTAVSDLAGLGLEGSGSGSGILDLTRESDDTSLGAELLDEIYTDDDAKPDPSEDTRAGLEEAVAEVEGEEEEAAFDLGDEADESPSAARVTVTQVVEYGPDAVSSGLTAALVVAVAVMCIAGLAIAGLVRGIVPSLIGTVYSNLAMFTGGAFGVVVIAAGLTYFLAKRSG